MGEQRRILFTYDAFIGLEEVPLPGPVFIHETPCERYDEAAGFPADMLSYPVTINAYASGRQLIAQMYSGTSAIEPFIEEIFEQASVDYLHILNTEAGCFDLRIERTGSANGSSSGAGATLSANIR